MKKVIAVILIAVFLLACAGEKKACYAGDEVSIKYAKSAVLIDADTGRILYEKDSHNHMSVASTTKIMTCIIALEYGNLQDNVSASDYAICMPKVKMYMKTTEQYRMEDLLYAMMLESYNDVAVAVAEHIAGSVEKFADLMNSKARELGMFDTNFVTPNGLDAENQYSSAYDMALIGAYAIKNPEFVKITNTRNYTFTTTKGRTISVSNKDAFLSQMQSAIGIKTGFTGNAGYCFVGATKEGEKSLVSCVLACGWPPNKSYKWADTATLMHYGDKYTKRNIIVPQEEFSTVPVRKGTQKEINTYTQETFDALLCDEDVVTFENEYAAITAPVQTGQTVGTQKVFINGVQAKTIEIKSKTKVLKYDGMYCLKKLVRLFLL